MLEYETFKNIFDEKIFAKSKADLLKKVAEYPDRYVGLFRPTNPEAKLLQNLLQSNEIRFGDAFEDAIKQYFISDGWTPLEQRITSSTGDDLNLDQLFIKDGKVLFIEQKVRDDHDSAKKRGQIENFKKKLEALIRLYGDAVTWGFFYFIDPSLVKNRNYYATMLQELEAQYGVTLRVSYGEDMFVQLDSLHIWFDIMANLEKWKRDVPYLPNLNFDTNPEETATELAELKPLVIQKLFNDERIVEQILPVLFPKGETLQLLQTHLYSQNDSRSKAAASKIQTYLSTAPAQKLQYASV